MRLVKIMGDIYKISDRNYRRLLRLIADGHSDWDVEKMGGKYMGRLESNLTDVTPEEALNMVEEFERK